MLPQLAAIFLASYFISYFVSAGLTRMSGSLSAAYWEKPINLLFSDLGFRTTLALATTLVAYLWTLT